MNEDIMKAIEEAARMATQDQERMEKEAFINKVAMDTAANINSSLFGTTLILTPAMRPQMDAWVAQNRHHIAFQVEQVVRIILRTELLGETTKKGRQE